MCSPTSVFFFVKVTGINKYLWAEVQVAVDREDWMAVVLGTEGEEAMAGVLEVFLQQ